MTACFLLRIGLGLYIRGGEAVPDQPDTAGAFVEYIAKGSVADQLNGELKPGLYS